MHLHMERLTFERFVPKCGNQSSENALGARNGYLIGSSLYAPSVLYSSVTKLHTGDLMSLQPSCPHLEGPTHADYFRPEGDAASAAQLLGLCRPEPVPTSLLPLCSGHLGMQYAI